MLKRKFRKLYCIILFILATPTSKSIEISDNYRSDVVVPDSDNHNVCHTQGCKDAAKVIRDYMDSSFHPCKNFYAFTCGGFVNNHKIPEDSEIISPFREIHERVQNQLKTLLEQKYEKTEPRIFYLIRRFYRTCVDEKRLDREAGLPLRSIITQLGGWPIAEGENWNETAFDWVETDIKLRELGYPTTSIFTVFVLNDYLNTTQNALYVNPLTTYTAASNIMQGRRNLVVGKYKQFMKKVAIYFNANPDEVENETQKVIDFESELAKIANRASNEQRIVRSIEDIEKYFPSVNWEKYINGLTGSVIKINSTDRIIRTSNPHYFSSVQKILNKTSKRTIANYMIWRTIAASAPFTGGEIYSIYKNYKFHTTGREITDRWKECLKFLTEKTNGLTVGVSSLYVRKYFDNRAIKIIQPILQSIFHQFDTLVDQSDWMDEKSKNAAKQKSNFMRRVIAYPDELLNDTVIDIYAKNLQFDEYRLLRNVRILHNFHFDYSLTGLLEQTDQRLWVVLSDSTVSNAYYYGINNAFAVLAGILQPPIFSLEWPDYAKFGSIGFIISHEMMHAFDPKNIKLDQIGNYNPLFSTSTAEKYRQKSVCFATQYGNYKVKLINRTVDGERTLNENIADNVGLKISYNAYKNWELKHPNEPLLPGFNNYTTEQIFWMTSIHFLCNKNTEYYRIQQMATDVHTLNGFRARGSISNSYDFARAFSCPVGSPMNPKNKCQLW